MRTPALSVLALCLALTGAATAQSPAKIKSEFRSMVVKAKKDPDLLMAAVRFAKENGLEKEASRTLTRILKIDPGHESANEAAGNVLHEGKWIEAARAEKLIAAELEKRYKAKGMLEVDGIWVEKGELEDARKGIFHHDGDRVNKHEKQQLLLGKFRHPATGELIAASGREQAEKGLFLIDGKWVDQGDADQAHSRKDSPWKVRTHHYWVVSTLPLKEIKEQVALQVDSAYTRLLPVFGNVPPHPDKRPIVMVIVRTEDFAEFGDRTGGAGSAHGAFLSEDYEMEIEGSRNRVGVAHWEESWGPYYTRHAAALALSVAICGPELYGKIPDWFHRALGGYVERHGSAHDAKAFGKQFSDKGGVKDVAAWLADFAINGELSPQQIGYNVYGAGLMLSFAMRGGDEATTGALAAIAAAFAAGKDPLPAILDLRSHLGKNEARIKEYLDKLQG